MRRLITSRGVWLALSAAVAAVVIVAVVRSRRPKAVVPDPPPAPPPVAQWPPVPILGTPTAEDLRRYVHRPSFFDRPAVAKFLEPREPAPPLDAPTRRNLTRWGVAGLALAVLAAGTYLMESAVFSKEDAGVVAETVVMSPYAQVPEDAARYTEVREAYVEDPADADCRPGSATPRVRKPDPKVTRAVNRQWRRIETWLKANAPRSYRTLGKPAKAGTIAVAEAQMGLRFPDDLKASLLRHNGVVPVRDTWGFGFLGNGNMGVREIRDTWRMLCGIDSVDRAGPRDDWWDGRMIPVGANGSGDHLVVDSARRDIGYTDHEGTMSFEPGGTRIRSYHALLRTTADALESGGSIGWWKPEVVDGELEWKVL
ncbi:MULTISPECIES: SMI1/KNR4 family protein [Nonomuraea]|uniref:SMI1/KNR4 family protein n=1 Tax=Nonomuraea ferruginea TaxID=46174 RepID=A0ABT4STX9_9ACTN|nr:SMI1/KNR4 family protein [Nonomuraea ferruginea]MDA0640530.1 SMI1/KNR4 family protein [Nonomuraea ferruginea]